MSRTVSTHIRSNVVGYLALFFALTMGTAYATHPGGANTVSTADIINGEVKNDDLAANAVGSAKLSDRSVKNADLSIGASSSNTIADGGIQGVDVKNNTLTGTQVDEQTLFNDDSLTDEDLAPSAQFNGTAIRGGDLAGTYPHPTIVDGAISGGPGGEIIDNSVTDDDLAASAVTPDKIGSIPAARATEPDDPATAGCQTSQPIPGGVEIPATPVSFGDESFDTAGFHSADCNDADNWKLVAPRPGIYQVSAGVHWNGVNGVALGVTHNGLNTVAYQADVAGAIHGQTVSGLASLDQDDWVAAFVWADNGGDSLSAEPGLSNFLAMHWVGPQ
jgi:hypothetical protein